jgi:hypothetical protein
MATMPAQKPGRSKQNFGTPEVFIAAVKRRFGITEFAVDFAAEAGNTKAADYMTETIDALSVSRWELFCPAPAVRMFGQWVAVEDKPDRWGWLNPPFSDIEPWAAKCVETKLGGGQVLFLVPAAVGSNWYRDYVHGKALVLFLNGRLCFIDDWKNTIDPVSFKKYGEWRNYSSEPLYPKDCILCVYSPLVAPGTEVWSWKR